MLAAAALALAITASSVEAQVRPFNGFYIGAEVAKEDVIGRALVESVDVLARDMRQVMSVSAGVRYQLASGLVAGIEGTIASLDGDFDLDSTAPDVGVEYESDHQTTIGGIVGYTPSIRPSLLIFGYASTVTRGFDVTVTRGTASARQSTTFGMRRYGVGLEARVAGQVHLRLRVGSRSVDYGVPQADFAPGDAPEYGLAIYYQFTS